MAVQPFGYPMRTLTLSERALAGLRRLIASKRVTQTQIAKLAGIPDASMTRIMKGAQPVTFRVVEAAAQLAGLDAFDLLLDPVDLRMRVSESEQRLLRYLRSLPSTTRDALMAFLDFYADDDPTTQQLREAHEHLRHLKDGPRQRAVAYLLFLRDGGLTPDLRAAFGLPATDEPTPAPRPAPRLLKGPHGPKK